MTTSTSPGTRAGPARDALAAAERGDRDEHRAGGGRVAADDRHTRLGDPLVELDHVGRLRARRQRERDEQRLRRGARGGEVAQVDRGGPKAELAPGDPVEAEVDALDERVLRDDEVRRRAAPRRARRRRSARAARAPRGARAHRSPRASSTALLTSGSAAARIVGDAGGAGADAGGRVRRVDAADRDHGHAHGGADRARAPRARSAARRRPSTASPRPARRRGSRRPPRGPRRASSPSGRAGARPPAPARPRDRPGRGARRRRRARAPRRRRR